MNGFLLLFEKSKFLWTVSALLFLVGVWFLFLGGVVWFTEIKHPAIHLPLYGVVLWLTSALVGLNSISRPLRMVGMAFAALVIAIAFSLYGSAILQLTTVDFLMATGQL